MKHIILLLLIIPFYASAQLPLITDNTGTQGKGNCQIELSNGLGYHNQHRCYQTISEISGVYTYGLAEKADIVLGIPFINVSTISDTAFSKAAGFSDVSIELKYRIVNCNNFSLAVKPGFSAPTGDEDQDLGAGKFSGSFFLISTVEISSILINANIGYLQNNNVCGSAKNIWHSSLAADYRANEKLHIVVNTGLEKNPEVNNDIPPAFALLGFYYFINDNFEIGAGYKNGITSAETKHSFTYSLTIRF